MKPNDLTYIQAEVASAKKVRSLAVFKIAFNKQSGGSYLARSPCMTYSQACVYLISVAVDHYPYTPDGDLGMASAVLEINSSNSLTIDGVTAHIKPLT